MIISSMHRSHAAPVFFSRFLRKPFLVLVVAASLSACSPGGNLAEANKKLEQANQKIAVLEADLAALKATAPGLPAPVAATPAVAATSQASEEPALAPAGTQWSYNKTEEKMTGGTRRTAAVDSSNTVDFSFPYSGPQNGRLIVRTDSDGKTIMFRIEKGQILCSSYDGCSLKVRFDDDKPGNFSATGPADGSSEVVFIDDYNRFLTRLRKAKRVRVSVDIYQQGAPVFEFDVSGFDFARYQGKS